MIVDNLNYYLENKLVKKFDIMIARILSEHPKRDAVFIVEGSEGEGKTNSSLALAYYVHTKTKYPINLFFRLEPLLNFAKSTEKQIIIWDEPALDSLSTDWYKKTNKDLIRLLMAVRKKRHFFFFNFTKFYKFNEYISVDRSLGMIHLYSRKEIQAGHFVYIRKRSLEPLMRAYKTSKKRLYKKYTAFRGSFPEVLEKHLDKMDVTIEGKPHSTFADYDKLKDDSIMSIGELDEKSKDQLKYKQQLKKKDQEILKLKRAILLVEPSPSKLSQIINIPTRTIWDWSNQIKRIESDSIMDKKDEIS